MKRFALQIMRNCGVFTLSRVMSANMARVLMYHNFSGLGDAGDGAVTVAALRSQLEYLRRHFHVVPLTSIFESLKNGKPLDRRAVALTIDDGRRNCYEFFFPVLQEFAMPATFFVVSSFIRRDDWVWTDKVLWLSEQPSPPSELFRDHLAVLFSTLNRLRPEARAASIEAMAARMGVSIPTDAPPKYAPCSWSELREMADSGLMEIGSHTITHPILAALTDEESWHELACSRSQIEEVLGRPVRSFCFPNGKPGDYRLSQLRQVEEAGYAGAVAANFGMVSNRSNPYELPRLGISGHSDPLSFVKDIDAVTYYQTQLTGAR